MTMKCDGNFASTKQPKQPVTSFLQQDCFFWDNEILKNVEKIQGACINSVARCINDVMQADLKVIQSVVNTLHAWVISWGLRENVANARF